MAEISEHSENNEKTKVNERKKESDKTIEEHESDDKEIHNEEVQGGCQLEKEDFRGEANNDSNTKIKNLRLADGKEPLDFRSVLCTENLCITNKENPSENSGIRSRKQCFPSKSVREDPFKAAFSNERGEREKNEKSNIKRDKLLEMTNDFSKSNVKKIHDESKDKDTQMYGSEGENSIVNLYKESEKNSDSQRLSKDKPANTTSSTQHGRNDSETFEKGYEEADDYMKTEGEEEDSEDSPPLHIRRETETTETEYEDSDQEDFPTEGLLKELHFLNASCERPSFKKTSTQSTTKTPKKQKRLDFGTPILGVSTSSSPVRSVRKKTSPRKRRCITPSPDKDSQQKLESGTKKMKFHKSSTKNAYSSKQLYSETSDEDSDDDECGLTIVAQEEKPKKRKGMVSPTKTKKKVRGADEGDVPQEVIELIKSGVDEVFEEKAERTHLTAIHVKNIIKNVMTDENVLAMVRNSVLGINGRGTETPAVYEPTLTRAKTKELMEQQAAGVGSGNIWAGLSNSTGGGSTTLNPETQALATTDFPDEDEDEEYRPDVDEHLHSDDESLVSAGFGSETGSPRTPCTPSTSYMSSTPGSLQSLNTPQSSRSTPVNHRLMVFKTPSVQKKNVQRVLNFDKAPPKEEVVSQRTRSKLPLTETPLECLEMAFKPPDVTKDMYETEVDDDDWKSFLIDFIHPLKSTEVVEDEEADPEYNILEDKEDALDLKEEMRGDRAVQISKKEINELLIELFETLGNNEETEPLRMLLSQNASLKEAKKSQFRESEICQPSENKEEGPSPGVIWVELLTAEFSKTQLKILQCQMVQHVQLLTTSSLLCFYNSSLDHIASGCTQHLEEMEKNAAASDFKDSFFRPFNLMPALETLKNFKRKTSSNNLSSEGQPKSSTVDLNPLITETILESSAFPYQHLLPTRMFQGPNIHRFNKANFVSTEDMLIAVGLERYLDPKYWQSKCRKTQYRLLLEALASTVKDILVSKTLSQATTRVKNIRSRANDAPHNPVLKFLETGKVDLPPAEVEPLLPCIPCPVQNFPETSLQNPYQKLVKKRNASLRQALQNAASKAALACEKEKRDPLFHGVQTLQKPIQNIVIIQSSGGGNQLKISADAPQPLKSNVHQSPTVSLSKVHVVRMPDLPSPSCSEQIVKSNQPGSFINLGNLSTAVYSPTSACLSNQSPLGNAPSSSSGNNLTTCVVHDNTESPSGSYNDRELDEVSVSSCHAIAGIGDNDGELREKSDMKENSKRSTVIDDHHKEVSDGETHEERMHDEDSDVGAVKATESVSYLTQGSKQNEPAVQVKESYEKQDNDTSSNFRNQLDCLLDEPKDGELDILTRTPKKIEPSTLPSIPTPCLDMPSLLTTPHKSDQSDESNITFPSSSLCTPSPSKFFTSPIKMKEIKKTDLLAAFEREEMKPRNISSPKNHLDSVVLCTSAPVVLQNNSCECTVPVPSIELAKRTKENKQRGTKNVNESKINDVYETSDSEKSNAGVENAQLQNANEVSENLSLQMSKTLQNQATTQNNSVTLVTSVYQSPIISSGVDEASPRDSLNISPQKTKSSYRRISPAKGFRSPIKTSPLKQVSPILRKYHKYSPKKRCPMSNKKLSPILPKISRRSNPTQRRLAPKPSKSSSAVQDNIRGRHSKRPSRTESFLHGNKQSADGNLLHMDDEFVDSNASIGSAHNVSQPVTVHPSEEEFEEYSLEDEDEEDEDEEEEDEEEEEEEDMEAAQQREEHLAALLKASSTIALRRGAGGDGFDKRLNGVGDLGQGERRLTKQQRRLQARISALSYSPDPLEQDKFMAQSFLMRVREALMGKDPGAFKEFLHILNEFVVTPARSPLQLYYQLCEVLKDYQHLIEEFVSFLLPQQAMDIGKYPQYCAIHRMRDFLEKLELQFCKQPKYIQKIIRLLQSMQNISDLNIEEVKAAMTPLLKYPHLVECFTQCFPSQPPAPSLQSDFEDISLDHPGTPDSMESLVLPDDDTSPNHCMCPCHASASSPPSSNMGTQQTLLNSGRTEHCSSCALRFSEGRIYLQCGKTLRPAKVTYQTASVKKEEFDEKSSHGQATGGNVYSTNDCIEPSTKSKSLGKGKLSQTKDPSENVHARSKENANKVISSGNTNNVTHGSNSNILKSRSVVSSEEKSIRDNTGGQVEKVDAAVRVRDDGVDIAKENVFNKNLETVFGKNESISDGKTACMKKACVNKSYDKVEDSANVDTTAKYASHCKLGFSQNSVKFGKEKASVGSAEISNCSLRNKESQVLPCSPPKEVYSENAVLPLCSKMGSFHSNSTIGELLAQQISVIDEREKPSAGAVIITDKYELQREHKATFCHKPFKTTHGKTAAIHRSSNTYILNEAPSVYSSIDKKNADSVSSSAYNQISQNQSISNVETKRSIRNVTENISNNETKRSVRNIIENLEVSPVRSSSSSLNVPLSSVTPSTSKYVGWTKDEDRMILTVVQQKGATDVVFQEISDVLPSRDYPEVVERFNELVRLMMEEADVDDSLSISSEDSAL